MMRRLMAVGLPVILLTATGPAALAAWTSEGGSDGSVTATSVNAGGAPTADRVITLEPEEGSVALSWPASTLASGAPVTHYDVVRSDGTTLITVCPGEQTTSCSDSEPVPGTVTYSVVPRIGEHWTGPASAPAEFQFDDFAPMTSIQRSPVSNESGWDNDTVHITLTASDPGPVASGVKEIHFSVNGGTPVVVNGSVAEFDVTAEAQHQITFWAVDSLGNTEDPSGTGTIKIDKTPPVSSGQLNGAEAVLSATDNTGGSGLDRIEYRIDASGPYDRYIDAVTLSDGQTIYFRAVDKAGNIETPDKSLTYNAPPSDVAPPVTSVSSDPVPNGAGWTTANTTLTLTSSDASTVTKLEYRNGVAGGFTTIVGPGPYALPTYSSEGTTTVQYRATDAAGNVEPVKSYDVKIDKVNPVMPTQILPTSAGATNNNNGSSSWDKVCDGQPQVCVTPAADTSNTSSVTFTLARLNAAGTAITHCWNGSAFAPTTSCAAPQSTTLASGKYRSAAIAQSNMTDANYRVVVTVTDGSGRSSSFTVSFTVS